MGNNFILNRFLVHEIRLYNCFIHPLFSAATAQISVCEGRDTQEGVEASNGKIMVGKPSYINHACWGSVRRSAIGDMVMIRATREIKKGEQLALEYITLGEDVELRQRSLAFNWEFTCNCKLCKVESEEPLTVRNGRETLLNTILGFNLLLKNRRSLIVNLPKILKLVDSLEATYKNPPSKQPRHVLVTALEFLMKVYTRAQPEAKGWDEVIRIVKHILKALGYVIEESQVHQKVLIIVHGNFPNNLDLPEFLTICSTMYTLRGNHVMAKAWQRLAADFYEVTYGERVSFAERYGKEFAKVGYKLV